MAKRKSSKARQNEFIKEFLEKATDNMLNAAVEALNTEADNVVAGMEDYFGRGVLQERSGKLAGSLRDYTRASLKHRRNGKLRFVGANIHTGGEKDVNNTEVTAKKPGIRNQFMVGRYPVSYGRLIEFSDRLNFDGKRSFFFGPWYRMKAQVQERISDKVYEAWCKGGD